VSDAAVPEIDAEEARNRVGGGAVMLDVREPEEWYAGRVDGSLWIPMGDVGARQSDLPGDTPLVVICRSGARSGKVVAALVQAGYDAVNLGGGIKAWVALGLPIVADDGSPGVVA
jgi:rhodanese-related sulfurtransferase